MRKTPPPLAAVIGVSIFIGARGAAEDRPNDGHASGSVAAPSASRAGSVDDPVADLIADSQRHFDRRTSANSR